MLDLGGFAHPAEPLVVALDVLDHIWVNREARQPTLVVIDEAHNICSAQPTDPLLAATTQRLVQIAGEGRKFGLWLFRSTQRPSKIHPNVLSQCDKLALLRTNSPGDLAELPGGLRLRPAGYAAGLAGLPAGRDALAGGFVPAPLACRWAPTALKKAARTSRSRCAHPASPLPRSGGPRP